MPIQLKLAIAAGLIALSFWAGWEWRDRAADLDTANAAKDAAVDRANAVADALKVQRSQQSAAQSAADTADTREGKIHDDFDARISAAIAGRDSELGRLRNRWAACETSRLSDPAAAASEAAQQDGLRRASAARILRACELAQSERDEVIDRYQALIPAPAAATP
ncbi:hypothetical protein [Xanthomonas campestris]|uniref:hypothetical protein n=1 Tax=Xanthomonas campestris TaxID=339 RepID=UPI00128FDE49|nr:hypothetical protein [Xanthomonas campestris]